MDLTPNPNQDPSGARIELELTDIESDIESEHGMNLKETRREYNKQVK